MTRDYAVIVHVHTSIICVFVTKFVSFPLLLPRATSNRFPGPLLRTSYYVLSPSETPPVSRPMGLPNPAARLRRREDIATPAAVMPAP